MYLPPRKDFAASTGFGEQSNNFGSDNNNGLGGVTSVGGQDTIYTNYGSSTKSTNGFGGVQAANGQTNTAFGGSEGSSFDQTTTDNSLISEQFLNGNNGYRGLGSPGTGSNSYNVGSSSGTAWTPSDDISAQNSVNAGGYGQKEPLSTARNQGQNENNYNGDAGRLGQETGAGNLQYNSKGTDQNAVVASSHGTPKGSLQGNSNQNDGQNYYGGQRNGGNVDHVSQQFSKDGGGAGRNTGPNSFGQKLGNGGDYGKSGFGNMANIQFNKGSSADNLYTQALVSPAGFDGFDLRFNNQNNPSKSSPSTQTHSGVNNGAFQTGGYNQEGITTASAGYGRTTSDSNQGPATTSTNGKNVFGKPNDDGTISPGFKNFNSPSVGQLHSQTLSDQLIIGDKSPQGAGSIGDYSGLRPGTLTQNSYGQSPSGINGLDQKGGSLYYDSSFSLNLQNSSQVSNQQSGSNAQIKEGNYGRVSAGNNEYNQGAGGSSSPSGHIEGERNHESSNNYGQSGPQPTVNSGNYAQSNLNRPANSVYNNMGGLPNGQNDFDQNRQTALEISNYGQTVPQLLLSSGSENNDQNRPAPSLNGEYKQENSANILDSFGQNGPPVVPQGGSNSYSPTGSQTSSTRENYEQNSQNTPTNNGDYSQGSRNSGSSGSYGENNPLGAYDGRGMSERNNFAQNSLPTAVNRENPFSSLPTGYGQGTGPYTSNNSENNSLLESASTGTQADSSYESRNQKKHSTLVPKGQYQNSNLPSQSEFGKQRNYNGNYNEPGLNAFSNFAPNNEPNQPLFKNNNNCGTSGSNVNKQNEAVHSTLNTGY